MKLPKIISTYLQISVFIDSYLRSQRIIFFVVAELAVRSILKIMRNFPDQTVKP